MPAHSGDLSDPAAWENPPVPQDWWEPIRQHMPAYDPALTPTRGLGRTPELFRTWPGSQRSDHPTLSFTALGPRAAQITGDHQPNFGLGEGSPLARIYDLDGHVLLLGANYGSNTSFHLAEYRAPGAKVVEESAPILVQGERRWQTNQEIQFAEEAFADLGRDFEADSQVQLGQVGSAQARFFRQRACVDYAVPWIQNRREQAAQ
jgi:aminoglycoside 3-N-acetyltransferase